MAESLNPTTVDKLRAALRPNWSRTVAARRATAAVLVLLAAIAALRPDPDDRLVDVVVAAHDLTPGTKLGATDVQVEKRSATTVPEGGQTDVGAVVGNTLTGPARRGEMLTDVRILSPRLATATAGPDARIVPLVLADSAIVELVHPGDVVDVLAAPQSGPGSGQDARPRLIATDAVVVMVSEKQKASAVNGDRVVLVALPAHTANDVAAAALTQTVTVTFH